LITFLQVLSDGSSGGQHGLQSDGGTLENVALPSAKGTLLR